jgi:hypothetical protein
MNLRDWKSLPAAEFAERLRARQVTLERYNELVAAMEADAQMEAEMRAAWTLPQSLPAGKLGDPLSYGIPKLED